ncbi:MAG TPA: hypothetical protein PLA61_15735, partial [Ferruginibacter sp.]|nr:hypothetical protein [Ferruginibacter sp.]
GEHAVVYGRPAIAAPVWQAVATATVTSLAAGSGCVIVAADLVALLIFFPEKTGLLLLFTLVGFALLTSMILAKYADYPGEIGLLNSIILAFCLAFPPLLLIAIPYFYNRATGSLNRILK